MTNQNNNTMNDLMDIFGSSCNTNTNVQMNSTQNNGNINLMNLGIDLTNNSSQMQMNNYNQINQQTHFMSSSGNNQAQQGSNNPFDALLFQNNTQTFPQGQSNVNPQSNNPNNPFNNDLNSLFG